MKYTLEINGKPKTVDVDGDTPLLWVLRERLDMVGTKFGCGAGLCGACTVHLDGVAMRSCQTPVESVGTQKVTTIEAIGSSTIGQKLQKAWIALDVPQCGYCQAGQIMTASAFLAETPKPSDEDIDGAMTGNICRCSAYHRIRAAVRQAAEMAA